jgi:hypothetical protein
VRRKKNFGLVAAMHMALLSGTAFATPKPTNGSSVGGLPDGIIDGGYGPSTPKHNITGYTTISPAGVLWTFEFNDSGTATNWLVTCDTTTKYFKTVTGSTPNDDVLQSKPNFSLVTSKKITFLCPYKTSAHTLNIAREVQSTAVVAFNLNGQGTFGSVSQVCKRATKRTINFTC